MLRDSGIYFICYYKLFIFIFEKYNKDYIKIYLFKY
jgi:hypothetical protein